MTESVRPAHLAMFFSIMLLWGLNFVVAKMGIAQVPPIFLIALRFALVAALLLPFVKAPRGRWLEVFGVSVTLGVIHFSMMFTGLRSVDAATAAIAIQLQVPFASLLAAVFLGDRLGWRRALGMAIAFVGVALIAGEPRFEGQIGALGLVVGAACIWSIANFQVKRLGHIDGMTLNGYIALFATPQLFLASALLEQGQFAALQASDWRLLFSVVYQAVCVVLIGYGAWYWLLRQYSMNQAMPFTLLVPLVGVASGVVFLDERLTIGLVIGGFLTIVGVGIITLRRPGVAAPETERV